MLNLLGLLGWLVLMSPAYETNDDLGIRQFVNGCREIRDPHLVYQNIVLGAVYKILYHFTIQIPWYEIVQYLTILGAFTAVTFVIFQRLSAGRALVIFFLMQLFFGFECYVRPQYTKTAGIAAAAGIFLLFFALEEMEHTRTAAVAGILLTCLGFMYRQTEAAACIALLSALGISFLLKLSGEKKTEIQRKLQRGLVLAGILVGCLIALLLTDFLAYELDGEWKTYKEFNSLRTELLDYGFPDYETNRQAYEELGINEDAFALYTSWNFNDPDKFNIEVMEELVALKPERRLSAETLLSFGKTMPGILKNTYTFQAVCIVLLLWLVWGKHSWKNWIGMIWELLACVTLYFYLFYMGRYGVNRVDVGLWMAVFLTVISFLDRGKRSAKKGIRLSLTAAGIVFCGIMLYSSRDTWKPWIKMYHQQEEAVRLANRQVLETLGADKEHLYLIKGGTVSESSCYGVFDTMPGEILNNMCWLNGWDCNTSGQRQVLRNFDVENPFRDLIDRSEVILADNDVQLTLRYIQTYYDENAQAKELGTVGNVNLYQIVSSEAQQ